jgi:cytochrome b subunit of formate dehydrogenase
MVQVVRRTTPYPPVPISRESCFLFRGHWDRYHPLEMDLAWWHEIGIWIVGRSFVPCSKKYPGRLVESKH